MIFMCLTSCSKPKQTIAEIALLPKLNDCNNYDFVLHFLDEVFRKTEKIETIMKKYPIVSPNKYLRVIKNNINYSNYDIKELYNTNKINNDYFICYDMNGIYRSIEVEYRIKDTEYKILVRFYQYEKKMKLFLSSITIEKLGW